jgi:glycosyltransferase involved in cell wall biosynthesis
MLQITIWMNMPTFYQSDLFKALASSKEVDLQVIFAKGLSEDRVQLGWQQDMVGYPYRFLNKSNPIADAMRLAWAQRDRIHVVNGLWAEPAFAAALVVFAVAGAKYAIYSEAPERIKFQAEGPRPPSKRLLQAAFSKVVVPRITGVLAISHFSAEFFKGLGVPDQSIYPFGYFRSKPTIDDFAFPPKDESKIEVTFVGRLLPLKRLDLLINVMSHLFREYPNLYLTLIGGGEMLPDLRRQVQELGLEDRVNFEGVVPPDKIPARLARTDLLVLPSRGEGWGIVVNEALSVGVPVILSDRCGAVDLIQNGVNGYIFRNGDDKDLRDCLKKFLARRSEWAQFRVACAALGEKLSTESVAPYMIECLKNMTGILDKRPVPPWTHLAVSQGAEG